MVTPTHPLCLLKKKKRYIKSPLGWSENKEDGKYGRKWHFLLFGSREKTRKTENGEKNFPSSPHFFILPIWEENEKERVLNDVLYTNTLTSFISPTLHFIHLI